MAIKGTEQMRRFPSSTSWGDGIVGINHYGTVKTGYGTAYKVDFMNIGQLASIGWLHVGGGTSYAYMLKPAGTRKDGKR